MATSPQVEYLKGKALENLERYPGHHLRMVVSGKEYYDIENLRIEAYKQYKAANIPAVIKRAEAFRHIIKHMSINIEPNELIVGSQKFCAFTDQDLPDAHYAWVKQQQQDLGIVFSDGHIVVDYGKVLVSGMKGIIEAIDGKLSCCDLNSSCADNLKAFKICAEGASLLGFRFSQKARELAAGEMDPKRYRQLQKIAEVCSKVPYLPAEHFDEALQAIWFTQSLMHLENPCSAISLGRFDQYAYPFLKHDLESGYITIEEAQELVDCLWIKFWEGDESQNLTIGGITKDGEDATNELTYMAIDATLRLSAWQPSLSVRIHKNSPSELLNKVCELVKIGIGQPSIFNDELIIRALKWRGLSDQDAADYSIVGCYEATGSGNEYGLTTAITLNLGEAVNSYIKLLASAAETDAPAISGFDNFMNGFKEHLSLLMDKKLKQAEIWDETRCTCAPSPFKSLLMEGCIEKGIDVENGGAKYNYFAYNVLGIATAADSLYAIKKFVFEEKSIDISTLSHILDADFLGYEELRNTIRSTLCRYGNDYEPVDRLAADLAEYICKESRNKKLSRGTEGYAGLFAFLQNVSQRNTPATPDGRKKGDFLSYAIAPSIGAAREGLTAILNSASRLPQAYAPGGCPLTISLMPKDTKGQEGTELLKWIIITYFEKGGFHLHFNITNANDLLEAKKYPERFSDLLVRISGYSARFITLDPILQDEIIGRVKEGI